MGRSIHEGGAARNPESRTTIPVTEKELSNYPRLLERMRQDHGTGSEHFVKTPRGPRVIGFTAGEPQGGFGYLHKSVVRGLLPHERISNDTPPRRQWGQAPTAEVEPVNYEAVSMMTTATTRNLGTNMLVTAVNHTIERGLVVPHLGTGEPDYIRFGEVDVVDAPDAFREHVAVVVQMSKSNRIQ